MCKYIGVLIRWFFSNPLTSWMLPIYDGMKEKHERKKKRLEDIDAAVLAFLEGNNFSSWSVSAIHDSLVEKFNPSVHDIEQAIRRLQRMRYRIKVVESKTYYLDS